jgi:hypothetical protein
MPRQVFSGEELLAIADRAQECRVVRRGERVKVKLRTRRLLYTYVTNEEEAEELLSRIKERKIPIVEF